MPVEIREISISLTLAAEESNGAAGNGGDDCLSCRKGGLDRGERNRLVDDCVRAVMQILKDKKEA